MGRKLLGDKKKSNLQLQHEYQDRESSIDAYLDDKFKHVDWDRRRKAEMSLTDWVNTYCLGLLLEDSPPPLGEQVLSQMRSALTSRQNYCILMGRGSGKTSYMECAAMFAIATGLQKFIVIISSNQISANNILGDLFRMVAEVDTPFAEDYPEICAPFHLCNGSFHRKQTYRGKTTDIQRTAGQLVFARLQDDNGNERPTSGSLIYCRGVTSSLRGMKKGTMRPTCCLLDDLQNSDIAANPIAVEKLWETIRKDIYPMAGKNRLSIIQTATQILPEDLVAKIKADKAWTTTIFPSVISFPTHEKLWDEYFKIWDEECLSEDMGNDKHKQSLDFYRKNFEAMNEGSQVFNPNRFSVDDGHISAIQKLMEIRRVIGESAFMAEYQQNPVELSTTLNITPAIVNARIGNYKELEIPAQNVRYVCASTDLNPSKYFTTIIAVFMRDDTVRIVWHKFTPTKIPATLTEKEYYTKIYEALAKLGLELKQISSCLKVPIQGWAIDCNGANWNAALDFARNSKRICGIPCCGFVGKASTQFRTKLGSRLKEAVNRTLLCGDKEEQRISGSGRKWMTFDSDWFHEQVQKGFLTSIGNLGSISWYCGGSHAKWSAQVAAERLLYKKEKPDGTVEYTWKELGEDHDALDAIGQALAAYASMGFSSGTHVAKPRMYQRRPKSRIRVV